MGEVGAGFDGNIAAVGSDYAQTLALADLIGDRQTWQSEIACEGKMVLAFGSSLALAFLANAYILQPCEMHREN